MIGGIILRFLFWHSRGQSPTQDIPNSVPSGNAPARDLQISVELVEVWLHVKNREWHRDPKSQDWTHFGPGRLALELGMELNVSPETLIEDLLLRIDSEPPVSASDWASQPIESRFSELVMFDVPLNLQPGEHSIILCAKADGREWPAGGARVVHLPRYKAS